MVFSYFGAKPETRRLACGCEKVASMPPAIIPNLSVAMNCNAWPSQIHCKIIKLT